MSLIIASRLARMSVIELQELKKIHPRDRIATDEQIDDALARKHLSWDGLKDLGPCTAEVTRSVQAKHWPPETVPGEAEFHKLVAPHLTKRQQGYVMGAFREVQSKLRREKGIDQ